MFTSLGCLLPCLCYSSFICSSHLSFIWSCLHFHTLFILQLAQLPLILACCFWIGLEISWGVCKFIMYHYVTSCFLLTSWISCISVAQIISPPGLVAAPRPPVPGHGTVPRGPKASGTPPEALPVVLQGWLQHRPSPAAALLAWSSQGWPSVGRRPGNFQGFAADIFLAGFDPRSFNYLS